MGSIFAAVAPIMLFVLAKEKRTPLKGVLHGMSPVVLMMSVVVLAYPAWSILGVAIGLLYPVFNIGNEGVATVDLYILAIIFSTIVVAVPLGLFFRQLIVAIGVLSFTFIGVFGWILPFLAQRSHSLVP